MNISNKENTNNVIINQIIIKITVNRHNIHSKTTNNKINIIQNKEINLNNKKTDNSNKNKNHSTERKEYKIIDKRRTKQNR